MYLDLYGCACVSDFCFLGDVWMCMCEWFCFSWMCMDVYACACVSVFFDIWGKSFVRFGALSRCGVHTHGRACVICGSKE